MKILQVISYFYSAYYYGGPGKLVYELSCGLTKLKHNVTVYSTDAYSTVRRDDCLSQPINPELKTYFFKNISNFLAYRFKFFLPLNILKFINMDLSNYDIIHIHEFFTPMAVITAAFASFKKIPFIVSAHGTLDQYHYSHRKWIKNLFMYLFGSRLIHKSSGFIAATHEEVLEYQSRSVSKNRIYYIPNGIDITGFRSLPKRGKFREKYRIKDNVKIILYLGRIHKLKGLDLLVSAFEKVIEKNDSILVIAGSDDGYLRYLLSGLDKDTAGKIIFPGLIEGDEKTELYRDADLFVYPSPREGFSIAIMEAALAKLPLVITSGCKFPEVAKYKAGIIVNADSEDLYQAMIKLLGNEPLAKKMGNNAHQLVERNFSIGSMAEKLEKIYSQSIK